MSTITPNQIQSGKFAETFSSEDSAHPMQKWGGARRHFLGNRFVYVIVSARARGLSIGVNLNPDKTCNFNCIYCEVDRSTINHGAVLDVEPMSVELEKTLDLVNSGEIAKSPAFKDVPKELLALRHVAFSGDGEPTLCPSFFEAVESVMHVRAKHRGAFFSVVLITNASGLDLPQVQLALEKFTDRDHIWAKLDAGNQSYMDRINGPNASIEKVCSNILALAKRRPVIIQSLFAVIGGAEPGVDEVYEYISRLRQLQDGGAKIALVQIYSASHPFASGKCRHLSLSSLSRIAKTVRAETGLLVEVF